MKKNLLWIISISILSLLLIQNKSFAQGSTCLDPHIVPSLPFNYVGTTTGSGNDYASSGNCGGNSYMTGEDYVFTYTPATFMNISITISAISAPGGVGLYVLDDCITSGTANCIGSDEPTTGGPVISQISVNAGTTYFIFISTYNYLNMNPNTDFTIDIEELASAAEDCGIVNVIGSPSSCDLSSEPIGIEIMNYGTSSITNIDVAYTVNGGTEVIESYIGTIDPGFTDVYSFTTPVDMNAVGTYVVKTYTMIAGDTLNSNDTLSRTFVNNPMVSSYPYLEDFESGSGDWFTYGENSSWELGTPGASVINSAASGSNCWATGLAGDFNDEEVSLLQSPCFDLTGLINPQIEMKVWYEMTLAASFVQYSTNNGYSWSKLGDGEPISPDWYNADPQSDGNTAWNGEVSGDYWITVKHSLAPVLNEPNVIFRIAFEGIITGLVPAEEGIAVDDIEIKESLPNDVAILGLLRPESSCDIGMDSVEIGLTNIGITDADSIAVSYSVNGGAFVTDTLWGPVLAGNSEAFLFNVEEDFSADGIYNITIAVSLSGDGNTSNDTMTASFINHETLAVFPYTGDFETNNEGWVTTGTNSSWELGTPVATTINSAASGSNSWVTNLSGNHNGGETSYLVSPCMDLSSMANPYLSFQVWSAIGNEPTISASMTVEVSQNGGYSWSTLGSNNDPDWYNGITFTGWSHNTNGWVTVKHAIDNIVNYTNVQIRLSVSSALSNNEGFGVDLINIFDCQSATAGFSQSADFATITFTNTSVNSTSYMWDFGDGNTSTDSDPIHTYTSDGDYTVSLIAENNCDIDSVEVLLTVDVCDSISAVFSDSIEYLTVNLVNSSTNATSYLWDFGDTNTSTDQNPVHSYSSGGVYTITLIAQSDCDIDSISLVVGVCDVLTADFDYSTTSFMADFTNISVNADSHIWDFGDGNTSYDVSPSHTYSAYGTYMVSLVSTSSCYADTFITNVLICDTVIASFADSIGTSGYDISFANNSSFAESYVWNFGDSNTSTESNPDHTYITDDTFTVTLIATNSCSSDTITGTIRTAISEIDGFTFQISPNPASDIINIDISKIQDDFIIELISIDGKQVYSEHIESMSGNWNKTLVISDYSDGVYTMRIVFEDNIYTRKIIIRK